MFLSTLAERHPHTSPLLSESANQELSVNRGEMLIRNVDEALLIVGLDLSPEPRDFCSIQSSPPSLFTPMQLA